jgi:hypothetical protein
VIWLDLVSFFKPTQVYINTVAAHLRAAALMETQHFFSKGHST